MTASGESASYVLGSHERERERLQRQHAIWRDDCLAAWQQAGWGTGQRLLDLGCGPGFASLDLAQRVGHSSVWVTPGLMEMVWEKPCISSKP